MASIKCGCKVPIGYDHYGCRCNCRLCRPILNTELSTKNDTLCNRYRLHFVCFSCRRGWKQFIPDLYNVPSHDPDDNCNLICQPVQMKNNCDKNSSARFKNTYTSIIFNSFNTNIKCGICLSNAFVGGYDLRVPKHNDIKRWKILERMLTNLKKYEKEINKNNGYKKIFYSRTESFMSRCTGYDNFKKERANNKFGPPPTKEKEIEEFLRPYFERNYNN